MNNPLDINYIENNVFDIPLTSKSSKRVAPRRSSQRLEPPNPILVYTKKNDLSVSIINAKLLNISESGLAILIETEAKISPSLPLSIKILDKHLQDITLNGKILWISTYQPSDNPVDSNKPTKLRCGVRIDEFNSHKIQKVKDFLLNIKNSTKSYIQVERRKLEFYEAVISEFKDMNIYYKPSVINGSASPLIKINGKEIISFGSNNTLGLSTNRNVLAASSNALINYGTTCGGSRLVSGNFDIQVQLESELAKFMNKEACIVFMTGYMANQGIIQALTNHRLFNIPNNITRNSAIFCDRHNHASIISGCQLAESINGSKVRYYRHLDLNDLEKLLKTTHAYKKIIISEGIFSILGELAPISDLNFLAKKYHALLYIDDAHGIGIYGENGGGITEEFKVTDVDITIGTMSKAFGGVGGFAVGKKELIEYLRLKSNTYIFSSALPPPTSAAILAAIHEIKSHPKLRNKLWDNVNFMRSELSKSGFIMLNSNGHIIPIFIGDDSKCREFSELLISKGFYFPAFRWPALPRDKSILRCMVTSEHTKDQILKAVDVLRESAIIHEIIPSS